MKALSEGLAHPVGGEVVVRSGEVIGRIYLYKGAVAWVNCSSLQTRVRDMLLAHSEINPEELDAALQDSRQERRHFAETLLAWGLIDQERLWHCLRHYNALHLRGIFQLQDDPQVLFVPLVRTYSAGMVFSLEEMLETCEAQEQEARLASLPPAPPALEAAERPAPCCALGHTEGLHPGVSERLTAALPTGALAAALVDLETRHVCGYFSHLQELAPDLEDLSHWLRSVIAGESTQPASPPREVLLVAEDSVHTVVRSAAHPSLLLWVMFDASTLVGKVLAHGHMAMKALEQELLAARPAST
jgi:hypothetical protein